MQISVGELKVRKYVIVVYVKVGHAELLLLFLV